MYIRFPSLINDTGASGVSYDSDAQAYFTAANITDNNQKDAWNVFVLGCKTDGVWSKFFAIYPFMGGNASSHAVNAKTPGTFNVTWSGTITHDANGITGNGSNGTGNTGFNCSTSSGSGWISTSASFGFYVRNGFNTAQIIGGDSATNYIYANSTTSVNFSLGASTNITTTLTRLLMVSMTSTEFTAYRDTTTDTKATASITGTNNFTILSGLGGYFTSANISFAFIASGLTPTEGANLNTRVNTLMTTLGRNV